MKQTFYCVMSEFYDNGTMCACLIEKARKVKPKNTYKKLPFADCYNDWFDTESAAIKALKQIKKLRGKK